MQIEEEEGGDLFEIHISVSDPEKIGEYAPCSPDYPGATKQVFQTQYDKKQIHANVTEGYS